MQTKDASEIIRNNKHGSKEKSDLLPKKILFANQYITKPQVLLRPSGQVKGIMKTMTDD